MGAHRYWRFNITAGALSGASDTYQAYSEVELAETAGGVNVIAGISATANNNFNLGTNPTSMLTDGSTAAGNWWANNNSYPTTLAWDLGSGVTKDINEIRIWCRNDTAIWQGSTTAATLQYSDDNVNWFNYWPYFSTSYQLAAAAKQTHVNPSLWPSTYWDPGFGATSGAVIDNKELQARVFVGTASVRSTRVLSSALTYDEFTIGATLSGSSRVGICSNNFVSTTLLGADNNGLGYDAGGTVKLNNATLSTIMTYTTGDRIGRAVDRINQKVWFRKNNGNWNNDVIGNQNPVGNVGGISFATMATYSSLRLAWGGTAVSGGTAAFASAAWTDTAPTGYVSIDTFGFSALQSEADRYERAVTPATTAVLRSLDPAGYKRSTLAAPAVQRSYGFG